MRRRKSLKSEISSGVNEALNSLSRNGLAKVHVFVDLVRHVSVGVEVSWANGKHTASSAVVIDVPQLS
jgi:hypothetical protein